MKTTLLIFYTTITVMTGGLFTGSVSAQVLSFSTDTVTREECDSAFYKVGEIKMYNHTDEDIPLKWERTQSLIPVDGAPFLIVAGTQYIPHTEKGMVEIDKNDSTEVIFHFFIDDLSPGDSAIYQIKIYAAEDSANTDQLLTGILYCHQTTSVSETNSNETFIIYPNPFSTTTTIQFDKEMEYDHLVLFNPFGQKERVLQVDGDKVEIQRDNLPCGVYTLCMLDEGLVKASARLMVID